MATDATNQMRAMIAELMGSAGTQIPTDEPEEKNEERKIERMKKDVRDPQNCRMFLLATCPHEILEGTRYDIGSCRNRHEFALRADYNTLAKDGLIDFDEAALSNLQYFLRRHRSKIEQLAEQLKRVQDQLSTEVREKANIVLNINEEIGKKLAECEKLGSEGKTDECEKSMREVEELKTQKKRAEFDLRQATPSSLEQQQKLRVCEVCAAYIGINDNDQRLADHFGGKLHLGFLKLIEHETQLLANVKAKNDRDEELRLTRLAEREKRDDRSGSNREKSAGRTSSHTESKPRNAAAADDDKSPRRSGRRSHERERSSERSPLRTGPSDRNSMRRSDAGRESMDDKGRKRRDYHNNSDERDNDGSYNRNRRTERHDRYQNYDYRSRRQDESSRESNKTVKKLHVEIRRRRRRSSTISSSSSSSSPPPSRDNGGRSGKKSVINKSNDARRVVEKVRRKEEVRRRRQGDDSEDEEKPRRRGRSSSSSSTLSSSTSSSDTDRKRRRHRKDEDNIKKRHASKQLRVKEESRADGNSAEETKPSLPLVDKSAELPLRSKEKISSADLHATRLEPDKNGDAGEPNGATSVIGDEN